MDDAAEQPGMMPYPMPQPMLGHSSEGSLQYHLDTQEIIAQIEHSLRAEVLFIDKKTGLEVWRRPPNMAPLLNEWGINKIGLILRPYLSKVFATTEFTDDQIKDIMKSLGEAIISDLRENWYNYEISDYSTASFIVRLVTDTATATISKSKDARFLNFLRSTQQIHELQNYGGGSRAQNSNTGSNGILNRLFGRRQ